MNPGTYIDVPDEDYFSSPGVSKSMLDEIHPPARLRAKLDGLRNRKPTVAMKMGTLIHAAILEPDKPLPGVALCPETYTSKEGETKPWNGNAGVCKAWVRAQEEAGLLVLKQREMDDVQGCIRSIQENDWCRSMFADGQGEVSIWSDFAGILARCRIDFVPEGKDMLIDIKKVSDGKSDPDSFIRMAIDRNYHVQAASYLWHWAQHNDGRTRFVFVVVEDTAPYLVSLVEMPSRLLDEGFAEYRRLMALYGHCVAENRWPGHLPMPVEPSPESYRWKIRTENWNQN